MKDVYRKNIHDLEEFERKLTKFVEEQARRCGNDGKQVMDLLKAVGECKLPKSDFQKAVSGCIAEGTRSVFHEKIPIPEVPTLSGLLSKKGCFNDPLLVVVAFHAGKSLSKERGQLDRFEGDLRHMAEWCISSFEGNSGPILDHFCNAPKAIVSDVINARGRLERKLTTLCLSQNKKMGETIVTMVDSCGDGNCFFHCLSLFVEEFGYKGVFENLAEGFKTKVESRKGEYNESDAFVRGVKSVFQKMIGKMKAEDLWEKCVGKDQGRSAVESYSLDDIRKDWREVFREESDDFTTDACIHLIASELNVSILVFTYYSDVPPKEGEYIPLERQYLFNPSGRKMRNGSPLVFFNRVLNGVGHYLKVNTEGVDPACWDLPFIYAQNPAAWFEASGGS